MQSGLTNDKGNFEIFPWNRNFETGVVKIDEQHRVLVEIVNKLARHCADPETELDSSDVLQELLSYVAFHFKAEEQIWIESLGESEMVSNHHATHELFFQKMQEFRQSDAPREKILGDLLNYLTRWLAFHILESDRRMALTVSAVRSGQPLKEARQRADDELSGSVSALVTALLETYSRLSACSVQLIQEKLARQEAEREVDRLQNRDEQ